MDKIDKKNYSEDSIQPKFNPDKFEDQAWFIGQMVRILERVDSEIPPYSADTRARDYALANLIFSEPLLAGVVGNVVSVDKSRGWSLVGPARQVSAYGHKMHNVENGNGWRHLISKNSRAWYTTNLGFANEIGFRTRRGPAETLYFFDPTKVRLTGHAEWPMVYYNDGKKVGLQRDEFLHGNSLPGILDEHKNAGFCAVERALVFTRMMIGLNQHHLEKFNLQPAKGIMHIKGMTQMEWDNAIAQAKEAMQNRNEKIYKDLLTFITQNTQSSIDLIPLSTLPDNFSLGTFVEIIMNGYALAFNYSLYTLWMPSSNNLGRGTEAKTSVEESRIRGELDFSLTFQEQLQKYFLPDSLHFQFDERDEEKELSKIKIEKEIASYVMDLAKPDFGYSKEPLIDIQEGRKLLAESGIIPKSYLNESDDAEVSDLQEMRSRVLQNTEVQRAIYNYPDEPVVFYSYPGNNMLTDVSPEVFRKYYFPPGNVQVLWDKGSDAIKRRYK